jgi:GNAT superfamily N-acetyltransferase
VRGRLERGDDAKPNRVLHLAFRGSSLVGCISSTLAPGWTSAGCGHWGLLAALPAAQGTGVGRALIQAAETRLVAGGCTQIQIEYEYSEGDVHASRLCHWYETKLGFTRTSYWLLGRLFGMLVGHRPRAEFRTCRKEVARDGQCSRT